MAKAYEMPFKYMTGVKALATDLSKTRYRAVDINTNGEIEVAKASKSIFGILQEPGEANKGPMALQVMVLGVSFIELEETIAAGDDIVVGTDGKAKKSTGSEVVIGKCVVGGTAGDIGSILLK